MTTRRVPSHGCGRRMALNGPTEALAEAVERRARMIDVHGALAPIPQSPGVWHHHDRRWADDLCWVLLFDWTGAAGDTHPCENGAPSPSDVGLIDGVPVAMCADCRAHHASPPPADASGALL